MREHMQAGATVAIIDDDELIRRGTSSLLRSAGIAVATFASAAELMRVGPERFACVISDVQMHGMSGLELLARMKECAPAVPVILITAFPDAVTRERALAAGAHRFMEKPCDPVKLLARVRALVEG